MIIGILIFAALVLICVCYAGIQVFRIGMSKRSAPRMALGLAMTVGSGFLLIGGTIFFTGDPILKMF